MMEKEEEVRWGVEVGRPRTGSEESVTDTFAMAAEEVKSEHTKYILLSKYLHILF